LCISNVAAAAAVININITLTVSFLRFLFPFASVFSAYVYYVVSLDDYQAGTSYIKASGLIACVLSGILGDILVFQWQISLRVLMWISGAFVWMGFFVGVFVIESTTGFRTDQSATPSKSVSVSLPPSVATPTPTLTPTTTPTPTPTTTDMPPFPPPMTRENTTASEYFRDSPFQHSTNNKLQITRTLLQSNDDFAKIFNTDTQTIQPTRFASQVFDGQSTPSTWKHKLHVFRRQLYFLHIALQCRCFRTLILMWIVGNAIFSVSRTLLKEFGNSDFDSVLPLT
jgi:hypothetical protein